MNKLILEKKFGIKPLPPQPVSTNYGGGPMPEKESEEKKDG